jgi:hypothetical protein
MRRASPTNDRCRSLWVILRCFNALAMRSVTSTLRTSANATSHGIASSGTSTLTWGTTQV